MQATVNQCILDAHKIGKWYQYVGMRDIYIVPGIIAGVHYPSYHMEECTIEQYNLG